MCSATLPILLMIFCVNISFFSPSFIETQSTYNFGEYFFTPILSFQMNDVHCQCMIEGQVGELGVGVITPAARWELMFGMRSCGLPALEIKGKNEGQEVKAVCGMFWKVWGILKRIWESVSQNRNRKGQSEESKQWEVRCQKVTYIKANLLFFLLKGRTYWHTLANNKSRVDRVDLEADWRAL